MSADPRPLSPHLQVWRWHITLVCSITHRASVFAVYLGLALLAGWALALAAGPETYADYMASLGSPLGLVVLFGVTLLTFYNLAYNVRQAFWDLGYGFMLKTANATGWACIIFAVVATVLTWIAAGAMGAFS